MIETEIESHKNNGVLMYNGWLIIQHNFIAQFTYLSLLSECDDTLQQVVGWSNCNASKYKYYYL